MFIILEKHLEDEIMVLRTLIEPGIDKKRIELAAILWCTLGHNN